LVNVLDVTAHDLFAAVGEALGAEVARGARLGGGDVAESYRLDLADGRTVFAKTHRAPPPGFFGTEAAGLAWLREPDAIAVPAVLAVSDGDDTGGPPFLVLEWIDEDRGMRSRPAQEAQLGRALAALHRAGAPSFGREDRRTTGSRRLPNDPCDTWVEFYATRRLLPLDRLAGDAGVLSEAAHTDLRRVVDRLADLGGPPEPPARLHGDLWAGNRLVDRTGRSWLIDPAAHGGHREFDLAMMRLFGGFGEECFVAYDVDYPLSDGWQARVALHQLAPLLVHAIKFGGSYVPATERALAAAIRI
jgi:fructosamine-3-kinase